MATPSPSRRAVSIVDAAGMLGVGRSKIYDLMRDGKLASVHLGKRRVIPVAAIDALVKGSRSS